MIYSDVCVTHAAGHNGDQEMPRNVFGLNPHYQFRDQDPVFDKMRTVWRASGDTLWQCAERCNLCYTTLVNWFELKKTHSPRHESVQIFYHAYGIEYGERTSAAEKRAHLRVVASDNRRKKAA